MVFFVSLGLWVTKKSPALLGGTKCPPTRSILHFVFWKFNENYNRLWHWFNLIWTVLVNIAIQLKQ